MSRSILRRLAAVLGAVALTTGLTTGLAGGLAGGAAAAPAPDRTAAERPVTPIGALDLQRYAGTWLQLATIPQPFQAQCVRDTRAQYDVLPDGLVKVVNTCVQADGTTSSIEGRARVVGPSPAQLEVTFVQVAGQWIFDAAGDYWVLGVDDAASDYAWAVVGSPTRSGGFVLSRTPTLGARQIAQIVRTVLRNGYDPCAFQITATTGGIERNIPLCHAG